MAAPAAAPNVKREVKRPRVHGAAVALHPPQVAADSPTATGGHSACTLCALVRVYHRATTVDGDGTALLSVAALHAVVGSPHWCQPQRLWASLRGSRSGVAAPTTLSAFVRALTDALLLHARDAALDVATRVRVVDALADVSRHPLAPARTAVAHVTALLAVERDDAVRHALVRFVAVVGTTKRLAPAALQNSPTPAPAAAAAVAVPIAGAGAGVAVTLSAPAETALWRALDCGSAQMRSTAVHALTRVGPLWRTATAQEQERWQLRLALLAEADPDGRVRRAAVDALCALQRRGVAVSWRVYPHAAAAASGVERVEAVRLLAWPLLWHLSRAHASRSPMLFGGATGTAAGAAGSSAVVAGGAGVRGFAFAPEAAARSAVSHLVDDAFARLCRAVSHDTSQDVRACVTHLLGCALPGSGVAPPLLLQAFAKRLIASPAQTAAAAAGAADINADSSWYGAVVYSGEDEFAAVRCAGVRAAAGLALASADAGAEAGGVLARAVRVCAELSGDDMPAVRAVGLHTLVALADARPDAPPLPLGSDAAESQSLLTPLLLAVEGDDDDEGDGAPQRVRELAFAALARVQLHSPQQIAALLSTFDRVLSAAGATASTAAQLERRVWECIRAVARNNAPLVRVGAWPLLQSCGLAQKPAAAGAGAGSVTLKRDSALLRALIVVYTAGVVDALVWTALPATAGVMPLFTAARHMCGAAFFPRLPLPGLERVSAAGDGAEFGLPTTAPTPAPPQCRVRLWWRDAPTASAVAPVGLSAAHPYVLRLTPVSASFAAAAGYAANSGAVGPANVDVPLVLPALCVGAECVLHRNALASVRIAVDVVVGAGARAVPSSATAPSASLQLAVPPATWSVLSPMRFAATLSGGINIPPAVYRAWPADSNVQLHVRVPGASATPFHVVVLGNTRAGSDARVKAPAAAAAAAAAASD